MRKELRRSAYCCKQHAFDHMCQTTVEPETTRRHSRRKLHSVLHCKTSACLSMIVNRNILELTQAVLADQPQLPSEYISRWLNFGPLQKLKRFCGPK